MPVKKCYIPINVDTLFRHLGKSFRDIKDIDHIKVTVADPVVFCFYHKRNKGQHTDVVVDRVTFLNVAGMLVLNNLVKNNILSENTMKRFRIVGSTYDTGVRVQLQVELF